MDEIPQGGAGGVPLHHDPNDEDRPGARAPDTGGAPSSDEGGDGGGDATTVEPGRARRPGADESEADEPGGDPDGGDPDG
ncbi:hypothetical protein ACFCX4_14755 [Kitasatospora sp. NPDC056327]|uniref:hypothetical protein n=1 Tax=Kitasatospora sp. NPDC056327 TaxID=3345785 RepID=UPI0035DDB897